MDMEMEDEGEMPEKEAEGGEGFDEWEVESMCRTLLEAEKIKADPKKMAACREHFAGTEKAIKSIQDLKDLREARKSKPVEE